MAESENLAFKDLFARIASFDNAIKIWQQQLAEFVFFKRGALDELAGRIKAGERTGNEMIDFLALQYSDFDGMDFLNGQVAQYLRKLASSLSRAWEQPVLVAKMERRSRFEIHYITSLEDLIAPPDEGYWHYTVDCGFLRKPRLFFDLDKITVGLVAYDWLRIESGKGIFEPCPQAKAIDNGECSELTLPPLTDLFLCQNKTMSFSDNPRIIVGRQAVADWLATCEDDRIKDELKAMFQIQPS